MQPLSSISERLFRGRVTNHIHFRNLRGDLFGGVTAAVIALPMAAQNLFMDRTEALKTAAMLMCTPVEESTNNRKVTISAWT